MHAGAEPALHCPGAPVRLQKFFERLGLILEREDEMACMVDGCNFLLKAGGRVGGVVGGRVGRWVVHQQAAGRACGEEIVPLRCLACCNSACRAWRAVPCGVPAPCCMGGALLVSLPALFLFPVRSAARGADV